MHREQLVSHADGRNAHRASNVALHSLSSCDANFRFSMSSMHWMAMMHQLNIIEIASLKLLKLNPGSFASNGVDSILRHHR